MKRHGSPKGELPHRPVKRTLWGSGRGYPPLTGEESKECSTPQSEGYAVTKGATTGGSMTDPGRVRDDGGTGGGEGRAVPVGMHHEGSFGVYMAHKIDKLRQQMGGTVPRLEGVQGNLFLGVVVYINGRTNVPVHELKTLICCRGGVVEAYNTSRCTHMICEALPGAKLKQLRKLRHPPKVLLSSWVVDSVRAGRKLPVAEYMVAGVYAQKGGAIETSVLTPLSSSHVSQVQGLGQRSGQGQERGQRGPKIQRDNSQSHQGVGHTPVGHVKDHRQEGEHHGPHCQTSHDSRGTSSGTPEHCVAISPVAGGDARPCSGTGKEDSLPHGKIPPQVGGGTASTTGEGRSSRSGVAQAYSSITVLPSEQLGLEMAGAGALGPVPVEEADIEG
ncbi:unnamed protein product, partial [Discosporangium mesarthrocarpum]